MSEIGNRYGRLEVIATAQSPAHWKKKITQWTCRCDCNKIKVISQCHLRSGAVVSCGCLGAERRRQALTIHGKSKTPTFRVWASMLDRCYRSGTKGYHNYGGRGIAVCDRWRQSFVDFLEDMGEQPPGLTIERVDNDGDYSPQNCRWDTRKAQGKNRRGNVFVMLGEERLIVSEASKRLGLSPSAISHRAKRADVPHQEALEWFLARQAQGGA